MCHHASRIIYESTDFVHQRFELKYLFTADRQNADADNFCHCLIAELLEGNVPGALYFCIFGNEDNNNDDQSNQAASKCKPDPVLCPELCLATLADNFNFSSQFRNLIAGSNQEGCLTFSQCFQMQHRSCFTV